MKHIVIIGKYFPPEIGGVERYTYDVARIAAKAHRVTVVVHNRAASDCIELDGNITIIRCGTTRIVSSQPISPSMLGHLRSLEPDLVHFNAPNFWGAAMLLLASYRAPLIVTHHADVFGRSFLRQLVMPLYRRLAVRAACVVVNSTKNAAASRDLPKRGCRIVEIPWGVDAKKYTPPTGAERTALLAERTQRFGNAPLVGFVGRFVRYKGLSILIEALSRLPDVHGLLVGDGPLRSQLEHQVSTAKIAGRVHFLGSVNEPSKIHAMRMMDMLTLPSNDPTEAFGLVQVEAQLMGLPVIASHLQTGVTDVTVDEITGLLVPPNDPGALAEAIARLVKNPQLACHLGSAGRKRALEYFIIDIFESRWVRLFNAVLGDQSADGIRMPEVEFQCGL